MMIPVGMRKWPPRSASVKTLPPGHWPLVFVLLLTAITLLLRVWHLNEVPPWLWWDEAGQGLDARDLLHGQFRVFSPRSLGKEPLYIYLTTPFVATWDGEPFAVRLAGAVLGALTVPALYAAGRALLWERPSAGTWTGLLAAALWATNYWPQSINRVGFRVNTLPLVLTLAVVAWLNWVRRPERRRALTFGALAGLTLATYLAARATLLLWPLLYLTLPRPRRAALNATLPWALLTLALVTGPLAAHFALHPQDVVQRVSTFAVLRRAADPAEGVRLLAGSLGRVLGGFFAQAGDPIPRHNIPGRPPFSLPLAVLFAAGLIMTLAGLRRREPRAWTLFLWWGVMILPAILAVEDNPHFLRLFGALPPALVLTAWPVSALALQVGTRGGRGTRRRVLARAAVIAALVALLAGEAVRTARAYFITWARETDLYEWFQGDIWALGERVKAAPGTLGLVPLNPNFGAAYREYTLDYAFREVPILQAQVDEENIEQWLDTYLSARAGTRVLTPIWREGPHVDADPKEILSIYLAREGVQVRRDVLRGLDLLSFRLGEHPDFPAPGRHLTLNRPFTRGLTLLEVRWGAGYPNPDRSGESVAAGTPVWAVLTWRLDQPLPDVKVTLDLVDGQGHRLAADERLLLDARHLPTSRWAPGTIARSYHLLTVPPTQPPGLVLLESRAYDAQTLALLPPQDPTPRISVPLATARVNPALEALEPEALRLVRPLHVPLTPGLTLLGLDAWPQEVAPGQVLTLRLFWQVMTATSLSDRDARVFTVALGHTGIRTTVLLPANLPAGRIVHAYADLRLPPDTPSGTHTLVLALPQGASPLLLGEVTVRGRPRRFRSPPLTHAVSTTFGDTIALLGADVPTPLRAAPGEVVTWTLVWQALRVPDQNLVRFVHLLGPDRRPLAQEDTQPCQGQCPTTSWLSGEVVAEEVRLALPADIVPGTYSLAVGWYDPVTLQRLSAWDERGQRLPDDLMILPFSLEVQR